MGTLADLDVIHLQCHIGTDTVALARRGARVTGLDFSKPALRVAAGLARQCGLTVEWVCADVRDARRAVGGRTFDVVYTGMGALGWLPDLRPWAGVVDALLRPGGLLVVESRDWERMRTDKQRLEVRDHVAVRDGARGFCIYIWSIPKHWHEPHVAEIIIVIERDGAITHRLVELSFAPYRLKELLSRLTQAGFEDCEVAYPRAGRYFVTARKPAEGPAVDP